MRSKTFSPAFSARYQLFLSSKQQSLSVEADDAESTPRVVLIGQELLVLSLLSCQSLSEHCVSNLARLTSCGGSASGATYWHAHYYSGSDWITSAN